MLTPARPGPYTGVTVVEFGRFIAAPYCGQLLADGGADVVKIEPITGDDARRNGTRLSATEARQFLNKNRGKRSVAVDLKHPDVLAAVKTLTERADVVITNFRPGQADALGLDYRRVSTTNPRVIYAENSAFGGRGPLAGKPGMDALLQAYTGLAPVDADGPHLLTDPMIDYTAALLLAWGIATALYHRERSGAGQKLDVSLLQAALVLQNNSLNHVDAVDGWRETFATYLEDAFQRGASFADILAHRDSLKPAIEPPYYGFFRTRDGVIALAAGGRALQQRVCRALNLHDPALQDPDYEVADITTHTRQMRAQTAAALATQTTAHWLATFESAAVPAGALQFRGQVLDDPQAWDNDYLVRLRHDDIGDMTVVGPPVKFDATPLNAGAASPALGRHTREVLLEAGLDPADVDRLTAAGAITDGAG